MSTFEYQRVLARLIVDDDFYQEFRTSPEKVAASIGVAATTQSLLEKLDHDGVQTFREVIQGSRATTFKLVLDELSSRLSKDEWQDLIRRFHQSVVLRNSGNWQDLAEFCDWLDNEYPQSRGASLARYQYLVQVLGSARPNVVAPDTVQTVSKVAWLVSPFSFEDLFDDSIALWEMSDFASPHKFVLKGNYLDDDLQMLEVDGRAIGALAFLRKPRTISEFGVRLGGDESLAAGFIAEFARIGLVDNLQVA